MGCRVLENTQLFEQNMAESMNNTDILKEVHILRDNQNQYQKNVIIS